MDELLGREKQVLEFIKTFMKENGTAPTIREIGAGIGLKSTMTTHKYFTRLVDKGYIKLRNGRNYSVVGMKYIEDQSSN